MLEIPTFSRLLTTSTRVLTLMPFGSHKFLIKPAHEDYFFNFTDTVIPAVKKSKISGNDEGGGGGGNENGYFKQPRNIAIEKEFTLNIQKCNGAEIFYV